MLIALAILIKYILYASALSIIGLCLHWAFRIAGDDRRLPGFLIPAGCVFLAAVVLKLLIANAQLAGSLQGAFSADTFKWIWRPHATQSYLFLGAVVTLLVTSVLKSRLGAVFAALGTALGFGMAGHTQGLDASVLWGLFIAVHVGIAGFWFAAPLSLYPREKETMAEVQHRTFLFSSLAVKAIPLLFLSGGLVLWQLLDGLEELVTTAYGRLLAIKLTGAMFLLGLGAMNKFWISEKLAQNLAIGRGLLRRTLLGEAALFIAVLFVLALATTITGPGHGA